MFKAGRAQAAQRTIEFPKPQLERLHRKLLTYIQRIQAPSYLHSGVRGRSYITNAGVHIGDFPLAKLDIRKFYPSTNGAHVYGGLRLQFKCSKDVAGVLRNMCVYGDHVPTGSCVSQAVAFLSHQKLFDDVYELCVSRGLRMTCYVDDITISGPTVNEALVREVGHLITRRGLAFHKVRIFPARSPKIVTGVVISGYRLKVPNKRQASIYYDLVGLRNSEPESIPYEELRRIIGKVQSAAQIEKRFTAIAAEARSRLLAGVS